MRKIDSIAKHIQNKLASIEDEYDKVLSYPGNEYDDDDIFGDEDESIPTPRWVSSHPVTPSLSLEQEISDHLNGTNPDMKEAAIQRILGERRLLEYGAEVEWDRGKVLDFVGQGPSAWLGAEVFEKAFDDGSMKEYAERYDAIGKENGI